MKDDCIFKKFDNNNKPKKTCPKLLKACSVCSTYIPNSGNIQNEFKYYEYIYNIRFSRITFIFSIIALLIYIVALIINYLELRNGT